MQILDTKVSKATHLDVPYKESLVKSMNDLRDLIEIQANSPESMGYYESWEVIGAECAAFAEKVRYLLRDMG